VPKRKFLPMGVVRPVLSPEGTVALIATTAPEHRTSGDGVGRGSRASKLKGTKRIGRGLRSRPAGKGGARYVFGIRGGRVRFVALASSKVARSPKALREHLKLAGM